MKQSVYHLRQQLAAESRRPFRARGSQIVRCDKCLLALDWCVCDLPLAKSDHCGVALIFYQGEIFKPSNTGRLIADTVIDSHAFLWRRTHIHPDFQQLLANPEYRPVLVFPAQYADTHQLLADEDQYKSYIGDKRPLFIFLDGTWREARKMFRSAWFDKLPVMSLFQEQEVRYSLRASAHDFQLGTADVATHIFAQVGFHHLSTELNRYTNEVQQRYLASKANHEPPISTSK